MKRRSNAVRAPSPRARGQIMSPMWWRRRAPRAAARTLSAQGLRPSGHEPSRTDGERFRPPLVRPPRAATSRLPTDHARVRRPPRRPAPSCPSGRCDPEPEPNRPNPPVCLLLPSSNYLRNRVPMHRALLPVVARVNRQPVLYDSRACAFSPIARDALRGRRLLRRSWDARRAGPASQCPSAHVALDFLDRQVRDLSSARSRSARSRRPARTPPPRARSQQRFGVST